MTKDTWNRLFREFEDFNRRMDEMFDSFMRTSGPDVKTYGYTLYRGPDGVAHVKEFGNPSATVGLPVGETAREPFTDTTVEDGLVRVVAELPGAKKEDIVIDATADSVSISVDTPEKKYKKIVALPCEIDTDGAEAEYNNGILEICFKSLDKEKSARRIEIE